MSPAATTSTSISAHGDRGKAPSFSSDRPDQDIRSSESWSGAEPSIRLDARSRADTKRCPRSPHGCARRRRSALFLNHAEPRG
jgi:hypothetical protein